MHVEKQGTCLGIVPRERNKEVKLTFWKCRRGMLRYKVHKDGRCLMMKKFLLNPEKKIERPMQSNSLFRTTCKAKDRVCKVIIDSGSTNNLVSTEMVEN
jgi:hypothetical protein